MADCSPVTFSGVSPQVFESLKQELKGKGFDLPGTSGVINGPFGITIEYSWDQTNETLSALVLEKNFFVSCNQIYDQIGAAVNKFTA